MDLCAIQIEVLHQPHRHQMYGRTLDVCIPKGPVCSNQCNIIVAGSERAVPCTSAAHSFVRFVRGASIARSKATASSSNTLQRSRGKRCGYWWAGTARVSVRASACLRSCGNRVQFSHDNKIVDSPTAKLGLVAFGASQDPNRDLWSKTN